MDRGQGRSWSRTYFVVCVQKEIQKIALHALKCDTVEWLNFVTVGMYVKMVVDHTWYASNFTLVNILSQCSMTDESKKGLSVSLFKSTWTCFAFTSQAVFLDDLSRCQDSITKTQPG